MWVHEYEKSLLKSIYVIAYLIVYFQNCSFDIDEYSII